MCGRFINLNKVDKLIKVFEIDKFENIESKISYNIAPSQSSLIISNSQYIKIEKAVWGYNFFDKKSNLEKNIINSRLETIKEKNIFRESFENRKCIIPANGYYEWTIKKKFKVPYFINIPDKEPIYFVGIWKYFNINKKTQKVFSIVTKPANDLLKEIHHRMPLTLTLDESVELLQNNNSNYFQNNIYSKIEEYFEFFQVSKFVNNPFNNSEECIKPTN